MKNISDFSTREFTLFMTLLKLSELLHGKSILHRGWLLRVKKEYLYAGIEKNWGFRNKPYRLESPMNKQLNLDVVVQNKHCKSGDSVRNKDRGD